MKELQVDVLVRIYVLHHAWYWDPHEGLQLMNIFDALLAPSFWHGKTMKITENRSKM